MNLFNIRVYFSILVISFLSSCASVPRVSTSTVSEKEATAWFQKYCSKGVRELSGELVMKSNTPEFKGQYPASLHFDKNGNFTMEVNNIIGGTLLRLTSDGKAIEISVPPKPKYNRKGVTHYLGLDLPILSQLLLGDLPCPDERTKGGVKVQGNQMLIQTSNWTWSFEKADEVSKGVPVRVVLTPAGVVADPKLKVELKIEDWDQDQNYAKKVIVQSPEGELKWTWRSRN